MADPAVAELLVAARGRLAEQKRLARCSWMTVDGLCCMGRALLARTDEMSQGVRVPPLSSTMFWEDEVAGRAIIALWKALPKPRGLVGNNTIGWAICEVLRFNDDAGPDLVPALEVFDTAIERSR